MNLTKRIWENNLDIAMACMKTNFVSGVKNGTLPKKKFQLYVAQDYFFLECFARSYGSAISKCNNKNLIKKLSELLLGVSEELILHETYAKKWDIDLNSNKIESATKKYTDFLDEISKNNSFIEIISAMTPCMRLYAWIGQNLSGYIAKNPYKDWILTYSDPQFENLARVMENIIDNNHAEVKHLEKLYRLAMELELNFFEAY